MTMLNSEPEKIDANGPMCIVFILKKYPLYNCKRFQRIFFFSAHPILHASTIQERGKTQIKCF